MDAEMPRTTPSSSPPPLAQLSESSTSPSPAARAVAVQGEEDRRQSSSPFFSRTFSDMSLFDLASSLLGDKAAASSVHADTHGPTPARADGPWHAARAAAAASTTEADASAPASAPRPRDAALDAALDALVMETAHSEPIVTKKNPRVRAGRGRPATSSTAGPTTTPPRHAMPAAESSASATLFDLFDTLLDAPPEPTVKAGARKHAKVEAPKEEAEPALKPKVEEEQEEDRCPSAATRAPEPLRTALCVPSTPPLPPACQPPQRLACLFVEVTAEALERTSGTEASMRALLSRWCALESTRDETAAKSTAGPGALTGPDDRLVLLLAPTPDALRQSLLSWTLQPFAENAALLPLFGCCYTAAEVLSSTSATAECDASLPPSFTTRRISFAEPLATHAGTGVVYVDEGPLDAAVQALVSLFHIDTALSVGLTQTPAGASALHKVGVPNTAVSREISAVSASCDVPATRPKRTTSRKRARAGPPANSACASPSAPLTPEVRGRVDEARTRAFWRLASWNILARLLWVCPCRPALVLRDVQTSPLQGAPRWLCGAVCAAISHDNTLALTTATRDLRARLSEAPALRITWSQRALLIAFATFLFGPGVVYTAVDVLRAHGEETGPVLGEDHRTTTVGRASSYVKGFCCVCTGYQHYRVTATLRRYVHVSFDLHLVELLEGSGTTSGGIEASIVAVCNSFFPSLTSASALQVQEGPWRRVLSRLACTCVPRSFEHVRYTTDGTKLCRHVAQLLFYTLQRQCVLTQDEEESMVDKASKEEVSAVQGARDATSLPPLGRLIATRTSPAQSCAAFQPDVPWPPVPDKAHASTTGAAASGKTTRPRAPRVAATLESDDSALDDDGDGERTQRPTKVKRDGKKASKRPRPHPEPKSSQRAKTNNPTPSSSSAAAAPPPNLEDHAFHQRALEYSLGLIRARAAEIIQSQVAPLLMTPANEASEPTADVPGRAQASAFSEVGALAWLQALLEVPHPLSAAPPSPSNKDSGQ